MPTSKTNVAFVNSLQELTCRICSESFDKNHVRVSVDGCLHVFGMKCLTRWVKSGSHNRHKCPTCRAVMYGPSARNPSTVALAAGTMATERALQQALDEVVVLITQLTTEKRQLRQQLNQQQRAHKKQLQITQKGHQNQVQQMQRHYQQQATERQMEQVANERQRQVREEEERQLEEHQRRSEKQAREQLQQELARLRRISETETAYDALTTDIVFGGGEEGLLYQFVSHAVKRAANEVAAEMRETYVPHYHGLGGPYRR